MDKRKRKQTATSQAAYKVMLSKLNRRERRILAAIYAYGRCTDIELSVYTQMPLNYVWSGRSSLLKQDFIKVDGVKRNQYSNLQNNAYNLTEKGYDYIVNHQQRRLTI